MTPEEHTHCQDLLGSLSDYIDGALAEELCREIERHASECRDCRIVIDTLRKTILLYHQSAGPGMVPPAVRERLYRRLHLDDLPG